MCPKFVVHLLRNEARYVRTRNLIPFSGSVASSSSDPVTPALPGQQLRQEDGGEDHQGGRAVLGRTVAAVGETGLAELGPDVGRRLGVSARVRRCVDVLEGAGTRHHDTIVDDLLHLLAHGPGRLVLVLIERIRLRWMAAVDVAPPSLLLRHDFLRERVVAEGGRRGIGRAPPASEGVGWLEVDHQQQRGEQQRRHKFGGHDDEAAKGFGHGLASKMRDCSGFATAHRNGSSSVQLHQPSKHLRTVVAVREQHLKCWKFLYVKFFTLGGQLACPESCHKRTQNRTSD